MTATTPTRAGLLALCLLATLAPVPADAPWTPDPTNPQLRGAFWSHDAWNDPCVLRVDDGYWMYLSTNYEDPSREDPVRIHRATSPDGLDWDVDPVPVLEPSSFPLAFDYTKVETPSVIRFGGRWHMYYCGISDLVGLYQIGHATSDDGIHFTKDPANPVLSRDDIEDAGIVWHVCEPGVIEWNGKMRVYFSISAVRGAGGPPSRFTIYYADTADGTNFETPVRVLDQTPAWPARDRYAGYSTPAAMVAGGKVRLFYDVYRWTPESTISEYHHVALVQASSADGEHFVEECRIFPRGAEPWTAREVRSPSPLDEGDRFRLWYAGDDYRFDENEGWQGGTGIGVAEAAVNLYDDGDGDDMLDACDCAPTDATAFRVPWELQRFRFDPDKKTLRWSSAAPDAGSGTVHDLLRGRVADLASQGIAGGSCLVRDLVDDRYEDPDTPAPGRAFWYLGRGRNACGGGSLGVSSAGEERQSSACD